MSFINLFPGFRPLLSVVVVLFNMRREAPRTLLSLSSRYQEGVSDRDYEVIVIDNGSHDPLPHSVVRSFGPNFRYVVYNTGSMSPVAAMNYGVDIARGRFVGLMVDGARILTPGVLRYALLGRKLSPNPVISTLAWHIGPDVQFRSVMNGYCAGQEDALLEKICWQENGYRLFEISSFAGSSTTGFFLPIAESNCFFMRKDTYARIGGYDERFDLPGGGLANPDIYREACELPDSELIVTLGEGTFHQIHGGVSTNVPEDENHKIVNKFAKQYTEIRGRPYAKPTKTAKFIGHVPPEAMPFVRSSVESAMMATPFSVCDHFVERRHYA